MQTKFSVLCRPTDGLKIIFVNVCTLDISILFFKNRIFRFSLSVSVIINMSPKNNTLEPKND